MPLVNIAQPFERSGMMLTCREDTGITSPDDFPGKTLGVWFAGNEYPFLAWMSRLGLATDGSDGGVTVLRQGFNVDPLIQGQADCVSTMTYNEYWQVIDAGFTPEQLVVFPYADQGVATLEDGLYVDEKPAGGSRVRRRPWPASCAPRMKGWDYARENPEEAAMIVLENDASGAQTGGAAKVSIKWRDREDSWPDGDGAASSIRLAYEQRGDRCCPRAAQTLMTRPPPRCLDARDRRRRGPLSLSADPARSAGRRPASHLQRNGIAGEGPMAFVIKGGTVVNADISERADVLVDGETIVTVGPDLEVPSGTEVIDAAGAYVMPGGIDPHTHMEFSFMGTVSADDFEWGTKAALSGGTTMIVDFCIPGQGQTMVEAYRDWRAKSEKAAGDYSYRTSFRSRTAGMGRMDDVRGHGRISSNEHCEQ